MTETGSTTWHRRFFDAAYLEFDVPVEEPRDALSYWTSVSARVAYILCSFVFWLTLNVATLPFGVFVEPLWRRDAAFRRLSLPGRIPVIAIALPILLAYASYRTFLLFGLWHVIGPFLLVAATVIVFLGGLAGFNLARRAIFGRGHGCAAE